MNRFATKEQGAVLLIALIFLIILTLLSVTAMRTSTMELRMASNEQEQRLGFDSAQSATETAMASNSLTVTTPGAVTCFGFGYSPSCTGATATNANLGTGVGIGEDNYVQATLDVIGTCPRSISSSSRGSSSLRTSGSGSSGSCAYFTVESSYDATVKRGGRVDTQQGYIKLLN